MLRQAIPADLPSLVGVSASQPPLSGAHVAFAQFGVDGALELLERTDEAGHVVPVFVDLGTMSKRRGGNVDHPWTIDRDRRREAFPERMRIERVTEVFARGARQIMVEQSFAERPAVGDNPESISARGSTADNGPMVVQISLQIFKQSSRVVTAGVPFQPASRFW